jgi:hypothetical protein
MGSVVEISLITQGELRWSWISLVTRFVSSRNDLRGVF